jgi:hypothetical protein
MTSGTASAAPFREPQGSGLSRRCPSRRGSLVRSRAPSGAPATSRLRFQWHRRSRCWSSQSPNRTLKASGDDSVRAGIVRLCRFRMRATPCFVRHRGSSGQVQLSTDNSQRTSDDLGNPPLWNANATHERSAHDYSQPPVGFRSRGFEIIQRQPGLRLEVQPAESLVVRAALHRIPAASLQSRRSVGQRTSREFQNTKSHPGC